MAPRLCAGPSGVSHLGAEPGCSSCCGVLRSSSDMTGWGVWNYRARRKAQVSLRSCCADGHGAVSDANMRMYTQITCSIPRMLQLPGPVPRFRARRSLAMCYAQAGAMRGGKCCVLLGCWTAQLASDSKSSCTCAAPRNLGSRLFVPLCGTCTGANACTRCHTDPSNRLMYSVPSRSR